MSATAEARWAMAVRGLALVLALVVAAAVLEAAAIRRLRSELQTLRTERENVKAGPASAWSRESIDEVGQAVRSLDSFYVDVEQGFARPGGLCAGGRLDDQALAQFAIGSFLEARASRRSVEDSIEDMKSAIRRTDAYRARRSDLALPPDGR